MHPQEEKWKKIENEKSSRGISTERNRTEKKSQNQSPTFDQNGGSFR